MHTPCVRSASPMPMTMTTNGNSDLAVFHRVRCLAERLVEVRGVSLGMPLAPLDHLRLDARAVRCDCIVRGEVDRKTEEKPTSGASQTPVEFVVSSLDPGASQ